MQEEDPIIPLWRQLEMRRQRFRVWEDTTRIEEDREFARRIGAAIEADLAFVRSAYLDLDRELTGVVVGHLRFPAAWKPSRGPGSSEASSADGGRG